MVTWLNHQWLDHLRLCLVPLPLTMADNIAGDPEAELDPDAFEQFMINFHIHWQHLVMLLSIVLTQILNCLAALFSNPPRIPHHTSVLTGKAWVLELMNSHPDCIKINLGVPLDGFSTLVQVLECNGITESRNGVSVEEQLGIFLYTCVTSLSSRLVGECFQQSIDTITK